MRPRVLGTRSDLNERTCRALNVLAAAVALILLSPLMVVIALAVKLTSRGPIFYSQPRVGLDRRGLRGRGRDTRRTQDYGGRIFTIHKFRSMEQADPDSPQVWAKEGDARITKVGKVLRQYRFDELPQLWNVLTGDMNLVGPRPEQPEIFVRLREDVPHISGRQQVRPGITGLAQVTHHYDRCLDDVRKKADLDLEYIRNRSPLLDLEIMARTVPAVVTKRGAI
ncbi:MAG TPA: sugar transferase [Longimicrobiales bacterium]|nr:sugar transferase [Longimicrobiales bacterium]